MADTTLRPAPRPVSGAGRTLAVISAGLSRPSSTRLLADRLAASAEHALSGRGAGVTVVPVELRDLAHDLTNSLLTGVSSPALREAVEHVTGADGLVAVTPIYNASYSGLFKSFFDVIEPGSLAGKPVLLAATGGTERHSLAIEHAIRPLFAYLRCLVVPTAVYASSSDWGGEQDGDGALAERIERAATELATLTSAYDRPAPRDPYADPVPFDELLAQAGGRGA